MQAGDSGFMFATQIERQSFKRLVFYTLSRMWLLKKPYYSFLAPA